MTAEQLLEEAEKLLDECDSAIESVPEQEIIFQGKACNAHDARAVVEFMTEMIREFVIAQNKPKIRT
jgi:ethanolamine utilization protein EutA (predicted chaperonin)